MSTWTNDGFGLRPYSRFGNTFLWNVYMDNEYVARVVLDLKKDDSVWINVSKHGMKLVTKEVHDQIQTISEAIAIMEDVCEICHLPTKHRSCTDCTQQHRFPYHELIKKVAEGQKVNTRPTLSFFHYSEDNFKAHVASFQATGNLPDLNRWY